jgi:enoyl-CoA hydratase/carnithine racemase
MQTNNNNNQISEDSEVQEQIIPVKPRLVRSALARKVLLKGENLSAFESLRAKILQEIPIYTEIENILVEKIISTQWKLRRAMEIERHMLNEQNEISEHERYGSAQGPKPRERVRNIKKVRLNSPEVQYIQQHQLDLEKAFQKALERLREEQGLRQSKAKSGKL